MDFNTSNVDIKPTYKYLFLRYQLYFNTSNVDIKLAECPNLDCAMDKFQYI